MANIIPFKTRQQLETEKVLKTMREWEDANWEKVEEREENKEQLLSIEEIKWLNSWVNE